MPETPIIHVRIPKYKVDKIDKMYGKGGRSKFINEAIDEKLTKETRKKEG